MWASTGAEGSREPSVEMAHMPFGGTGWPSVVPRSPRLNFLSGSIPKRRLTRSGSRSRPWIVSDTLTLDVAHMGTDYAGSPKRLDSVCNTG